MWPVTDINRVRGWAERHAASMLIAGSALAIAYHARLWSRDRRRQTTWHDQAPGPPAIDSSRPLVSILLPAWNEADHIDACLQALINLRYPNKQIVVCAGGIDDTLQRARSYADHGVLVLPQQGGEGKQQALRRCYQVAAGEVLYLTDADCLVDDVTFESVVGPVISGEAAATGAWQPLAHQANDPFVRHQWAHHVYRELWLSDPAPALDGRNAAVARWALEDVGAFALDTPIGTDFVLSRQLSLGGYPIRFVPGSRVQTAYPESLPSYWQQQSRWFRNPVILGWQWGEWSLVSDGLRIGLLALLMLAAPIAILSTRSRAFLAGWLLAVAHLWLSTARANAVLARDRDQSMRATTCIRLLIYLPIGWIAMVLGLKDLVMPSRRLLW